MIYVHHICHETGNDGSVNFDASDGEECGDKQRTVSEQSAQCVLALKSY